MEARKQYAPNIFILERVESNKNTMPTLETVGNLADTYAVCPTKSLLKSRRTKRAVIGPRIPSHETNVQNCRCDPVWHISVSE